MRTSFFLASLAWALSVRLSPYSYATLPIHTTHTHTRRKTASRFWTGCGGACRAGGRASTHGAYVCLCLIKSHLTGCIHPQINQSVNRSTKQTSRGLAERTAGFSGADLANLLRRAALHALAAQEDAAVSAAADSIPLLTPRHVEEAMAATRPSTTEEQVARYAAFARKHGGGGFT